MITFSNTVKQLLAAPTIEAFYLVDFNNYKTTNYFSNITLSDGSTYENDGRLMQVDPPQLSTSVDRELYKITFADPDFSFGPLVDTGIVGSPVSVRIGFVNQETKLPYTNIQDTVLVYKGKVDNGAYSISTQDTGEATFVLTCASPLADLDSVRALYTSRDALRSVSPNDTSFDQIYEGAGQVELKWGKG
jgi:hypothetical protein